MASGDLTAGFGELVERSLTSELAAEVRRLFTGRVNVADGVIPPLVFVSANGLAGLAVGAALSLTTAVAIVIWRLSQGRALRFAVAGLGGTLIAVLVAVRSADASSYFLPGIISGAVTTLAIVASVVLRRPFVAWTSWLMRGWPIEWYWHPRVRPAYSRASWLWAGFFGSRTAIQGWLFAQDETTALGVVRVITGWPALLGLLVVTYLLGRSRLRTLGGPSVEEFESGSAAPWQGQQTGF